MSKKQSPLLVLDDKTKRVLIVTKYGKVPVLERDENGVPRVRIIWQPKEQFDVTEQFEAVVKELRDAGEPTP